MWLDEVRHAWRLFRREPGFAGIAVLTLALGIGANTALFAVVNAVLLRPLPFEQADDLVVLRHRAEETGLTKPDVAMGDFLDLRARQRSFESLAGYGGFRATLAGTGDAVRVEGAAVTPDALTTLRIQPAMGRLLGDDDAFQGGTPGALVSQDLWQSRLGSDPAILSRSITLEGIRFQVVGILPAGFRFPGMPRTDVVVAQRLPAAVPAQRRSGWMYGLARLKPGVTLEQAQAELTSLSRQFAVEHPDQNRGSLYEARRLRDALVGDTRRALLLLLAAVAFVQLIVCANVGNLLLARTLGREHELSVRRALGASQLRLVRLVLTEALVIAGAGGVAGVLLAAYAAPVVAALVPDGHLVPGLDVVSLDPRVSWFATGTALVSALLAGTVACVALAGSARVTLTRERAATNAPGTGRAASVLVVAEIALALAVLAGAGLTIRSFVNLLAVDPGFTSASVLTLQLSLPETRYKDEAARRDFYERAFAALERLPEVERAGAAIVTPLTGNNWTVPLERVDRPLPQGQRPPEVGWQLASEGYFRALRIPLRDGRLFGPHDTAGPMAVVVSESVARQFFGDEPAVGRRVRMGTENAEIVGVVGDIRRGALTDDPRADLYVPFERAPSPSTTLFVRTRGEPLEALPAVRSVLRGLEPGAAVDEVRTLGDIAEASAAANRLATRLLGTFAALGLALASIGVYGVMSYRVRRRTRELGTRLALGASPRDLTRLVLRQAAAVSVAGMAAGGALAVVFGQALSSLLFGVRPWDPLTLLGAIACLGAAALAASYLPARRAGRIDPMQALGGE